MKEMHEGEERGGIIMVCSIARATLSMWKCACFRTGIGLRRDFISSCFRNSVGEAYRLRYTYFSDLVARTIKATSAQENEWVRG